MTQPSALRGDLPPPGPYGFHGAYPTAVPYPIPMSGHPGAAMPPASWQWYASMF